MIRDLTPVVLAGGDSTRFESGDKALATLDGRPMLERVVARTRTMSGARTIVAVGDRERAKRYREALSGWTTGVRFVTDDESFAGPTAGLAAAVDRADTEWLFVCGCDQPFVSTGLVGTLAEHATSDTAAIVPTIDGETHPLGALYRRPAVQRALPDLPVSVGLSRLFDELNTARVEIEEESEQRLANVNTVDELSRARDSL